MPPIAPDAVPEGPLRDRNWSPAVDIGQLIVSPHGARAGCEAHLRLLDPAAETSSAWRDGVPKRIVGRRDSRC